MHHSPRARHQAKSSRRNLLLGSLGLASIAALTACGQPPPGTGPSAPGPVGSPGAPTPTPRRILGIFPQPPPPSPTPTPEPIVVRFAHWETGLAGQTLSSICDRFVRATPGVIVRPDVMPFSLHFARLRQAMSAGNPPDVFLGSGAYDESFFGPGTLLDLAKPMSADRVDLTAYWTDSTSQPVDARQYGLPLWASSEIVFYNHDHFAEMKAVEPRDDWTWGDLLSAAQKLTQGKPGEVTRWGLLVVDDVVGGWGSFVASNGGDWLDQSRRRTALQSAPTLEALQWLVDAAVVHHVAPLASEQQRLSRAGQIDLFLAGNVSMFPSGTWEMPSALAQANFQWDILPLPRAPRTGDSTSLSSAQPASIAQATRHPDQSWQLLRFFLGQEAQTMLAAGKVKLPSLKVVAKDQTTGYSSPPPARAVAAVQALEHSRAIDFVPGWQACRSAVVNALEPAFDGRIPLADAVKQATAAGDAALSSGTTT